MRRFNLEDEIKYLRKQNRILKRQIGQLKKNQKVDVRVERQKWFQEGYDTCRDQLLNSSSKQRE